MIKKFILIFITICCLANSAFASDQKEIQLIQQAKITLSKAIEIAEQSLTGKAISAEIDDDLPTPTFEVKVVKENLVYEVVVDGTTGTIIKSALDH